MSDPERGPAAPRILPRGGAAAPLLDRELELDLVGVAFVASFRLDLVDDPRAHHALEVVTALDPKIIESRDVRHVLLAVQAVIREHGVAAPALVRDVLRQRRAWDAMRFVLPQVVGGAAGVVAAIDGYRDRLVDLANRRAEFTRCQRRAADLLGGDR